MSDFPSEAYPVINFPLYWPFGRRISQSLMDSPGIGLVICNWNIFVAITLNQLLKKRQKSCRWLLPVIWTLWLSCDAISMSSRSAGEKRWVVVIQHVWNCTVSIAKLFEKTYRVIKAPYCITCLVVSLFAIQPEIVVLFPISGCFGVDRKIPSLQWNNCLCIS